MVYYAVSTTPGAVPKTSTIAPTKAILPYVVEFANKGWETAMRENPGIKRGANVGKGKVTYKSVANASGLEYVSIDNFL